MTHLPLGKLPPDLLARLLARAPVSDPRVRVRAGIGMDCAVVEVGESLLVLKSDPITFATEEIGWYLVQVNANDLATTGATPRWLMLTMLLPEGQATSEMAERIADQVYQACAALGVSVIGGHSEVTYGLNRPILIGTLIGETTTERLVTPQGARPGDRLLLTKGVPIEATALLARERPERLAGVLGAVDLERARAFLTDPGLSVMRDAAVAQRAGRVTAMHDPTEGGLASALWELAEASGHDLWFEPDRVPVPPLARRVCEAFGLDPLAAIASGALLFTAPAADAGAIGSALAAEGIAWAEIGRVETRQPGQASPAVWRPGPAGRAPLPRPARDEVARVFEEG
jgi:hydrogenase expression/formation protein HypE